MTWEIKHFNELSTTVLQQIYYQRVHVFVVEQNCPYQEVDHKDLEAFHIYKSNNKGEIIAYTRVIPKINQDDASFGRVLVNQHYRGQGLAKQMLQRVMEFMLHELQEDFIRIQAQTYLEHFYASFGLVKNSETYLEDGIPHIEMILEQTKP